MSGNLPGAAGAPAYPSHGTMGEVVETGLTKREHFAAMAMQGLLANRAVSECSPRPGMNIAQTYAAAAVEAADALLAELAKERMP